MRISLVALSILLLMQCKSKLPAFKDCASLRNGKFYLYQKDNGYHYEITRNENIQNELEVETGNESRWEILWTGDCEYKLRLVKDNYGLRESMKEKQSDITVSITIVDKTDSYYIFQNTDGPSFAYLTDTMFFRKQK